MNNNINYIFNIKQIPHIFDEQSLNNDCFVDNYMNNQIIVFIIKAKLNVIVSVIDKLEYLFVE